MVLFILVYSLLGFNVASRIDRSAVVGFDCDRDGRGSFFDFPAERVSNQNLCENVVRSTGFEAMAGRTYDAVSSG